LDILDVEKNSAVMSFSDCDPKVHSILFLWISTIFFSFCVN
jgi:hypothetical protein